jgi:type IV fimbrial biogenesis protein FimT
MNKSKQTGLTLVELMVTIALIGIVASLATGSWGSFIQTTSTTTYKQDLFNSLTLAKSEAITRNTRVTVCQRAPGAVIACDIGANWNNGWIVFVDVNNDGFTIVQPAADPNANIIHVQGPLKGNYSLTGNNNITNNVSFTRLGFPRVPGAGGLQIGTFLLCGPQGYDKQSRKISIAPSGRIRGLAPQDDDYDKRGPKICPA